MKVGLPLCKLSKFFLIYSHIHTSTRNRNTTLSNILPNIYAEFRLFGPEVAMNKFTNSQIHKSMAFVIEIRIQTSKSPISNEKSTKIGNDISIFNLNEQKKQ